MGNDSIVWYKIWPADLARRQLGDDKCSLLMSLCLLFILCRYPASPHQMNGIHPFKCVTKFSSAFCSKEKVITNTKSHLYLYFIALIWMEKSQRTLFTFRGFPQKKAICSLGFELLYSNDKRWQYNKNPKLWAYLGAANYLDYTN